METITYAQNLPPRGRRTGNLHQGDSSIRYFTGFTGGESLLYVDALRAVLITDSRYILQAQQQAP